MLLIFVVLLLGTLSFQYFNISTKMSCLNRVVINTPRELFSVSIPLYQDDEDPIMYFDKEKLERTVNEYYELNVSKYVETYNTKFYYFNPEDESMCIDEYCSSVDLTFTAKLGLNINYKRLLTFQIVEGAMYGKWENY